MVFSNNEFYIKRNIRANWNENTQEEFGSWLLKRAQQYSNVAKYELPCFGFGKTDKSTKNTTDFSKIYEIILDFDKLNEIGNIKDLFEKVKKLDYVWITYITPSGNGLRVLVKSSFHFVNSKHYQDNCIKLSKKISEDLNLDFEKHLDLKHASGNLPTFIPNNPNNIHINYNSTIFEIDDYDGRIVNKFTYKTSRLIDFKDKFVTINNILLKLNIKLFDLLFSNNVLPHIQSHCPFNHLHSNRSSNRDFILYFSKGKPTLKCFHNSCSAEIQKLQDILQQQFKSDYKVDISQAIKKINGQEFFIDKYVSEHPDIIKKIFNNYNPSLVYAETGDGKSSAFLKYALKNNLKVLFTAPLTSIIEQLETNYKISCSYGYKINADSNVIAATYDKIESIVKTLKRNKTYLKDFTLIVDEAHNLVNIQTYRKECLELIENYKHLFKNIIYITGTPELNNFYNIDTYIFKKKIITLSIKNNYNIVTYSSFGLEKIVESICNNRIDNYIDVLFLNDIGKLETVQIELNKRNISTLIINSPDVDKDENHIYHNILKNSLIPDNINVVLTTCKISEGINILNNNINNVYFLDNSNFTLIIQSIARFRNKINNVFDFISGIGHDDIQYPNYDFFIKNFSNDLNNMKILFDNDIIDPKNLFFHSQDTPNYFYSKNGKTEVNLYYVHYIYNQMLGGITLHSKEKRLEVMTLLLKGKANNINVIEYKDKGVNLKKTKEELNEINMQNYNNIINLLLSDKGNVFHYYLKFHKNKKQILDDFKFPLKANFISDNENFNSFSYGNEVFNNKTKKDIIFTNKKHLKSILYLSSLLQNYNLSLNLSKLPKGKCNKILKHLSILALINHDQFLNITKDNIKDYLINFSPSDKIGLIIIKNIDYIIKLKNIKIINKDSIDFITNGINNCLFSKEKITKLIHLMYKLKRIRTKEDRFREYQILGFKTIDDLNFNDVDNNDIKYIFDYFSNQISLRLDGINISSSNNNNISISCPNTNLSEK